ncbi:50S ribosomal protein L4 [Helicobacter winghamensis]|uniref:Large ribosomal subunit protein uL4 n=1 Tax=Helicobacter winghamensis TaxID=157268 RepID=A0A2N3PJB4_9HELI|nr:50S ribosomal protein L4 [Helicobacter winghamensis]EEO25380.1 50S ribosomal protein L4 [Helicobacter winghamensis ATCC BAA-430]PKT78181.1 50S ribosomal protein L4 [Helicobacter winghamensis]PKT78450.1 50S ribosomal protein L4 [Helicobacter winghamensis]PKT78710.1 50S ribosomal protein L4 [Helicobacter winghamensis]PKT80481.1 50S ribosomal protein L4 [Helicobacter winghamensis]
MSAAIILDKNLKKSGEAQLPESYKDINSHNLYLYIKSFLASMRANNAIAKTRGRVSGGGKKPWNQKGGGRARAGSITSPVFVGGGVAHGPSNNKNYNLKVNKKQKRLALQYALMEKANNGSLFIVDKIQVESGKTKDAYMMFKALNQRNTLFVSELFDEKTFLAFRNIKDCYLIDGVELNAYLVATFRSVVIEKSLFESITKED